MNEHVTVRIRGPYATALTKIFIDDGYEIVQASEPIQRRFSITFNPKPADVTIKSDEELQNILLLIGNPQKVDAALLTIKKKIGLIYSEESLIEQYSTIALTIKEKSPKGCVGTYNNLKVQVETEECIPGKVLPAVVITPVFKPQEIVKAKKGYALYTPIYTLYSWGQVSISEHIKNDEILNKLLELSQQVLSQGYGIKWSSNVIYTPFTELKDKLTTDIEKLKLLIKNGITEPNKIISQGRKIVKLYSNTHSDLLMDYIRNIITPTIPSHHTLKTLSKDYDLLIEFVEKTMEFNPQAFQIINNAFRRFITEKMRGEKKIFIRHRKLNGNEYLLGPYQIKETKDDVIILQRYIKSHGYYDGIKEKKEPGDIGLTITSYQSNIVLHIYYSSKKEIKGAYVNINTPVISGWNNIVYNDLEVDIVYSPSMGVEIQEDELLRQVLREGRISDDLVNVILDYARSIKERVEENIQLLTEPYSFYEKIALQKTQPELLSWYINPK